MRLTAHLIKPTWPGTFFVLNFAKCKLSNRVSKHFLDSLLSPKPKNVMTQSKSASGLFTHSNTSVSTRFATDCVDTDAWAPSLHQTVRQARPSRWFLFLSRTIYRNCTIVIHQTLAVPFAVFAVCCSSWLSVLKQWITKFKEGQRLRRLELTIQKYILLIFVFC